MPIDMSAAVKAPPRKTVTGKTAPAPVKVADYKSPLERRTEGLNGLGQLAQGLCVMAGLYADAATIGMHFQPVAKELAEVADSNERIAKPIDLLIEVGPYGALIQAAIPFVMQILANHKVIKTEAMIGTNVVPPEVLHAQMKAQLMRVQAQAMREQQAAIAEAEAVEREMQELMKQNGSVPTP